MPILCFALLASVDLLCHDNTCRDFHRTCAVPYRPLRPALTHLAVVDRVGRPKVDAPGAVCRHGPLLRPRQ